MAEQTQRRRKIRRYTFHGLEEEEIYKMPQEEVCAMFRSRMRRRLKRSQGFKGPYLKLLERLKKSKLNVPAGEKPEMVRTRLRNCIVVPAMVGSIVGVYNGKDYMPVEVKFDMIGSYLGEFAITYKHTRHSKTGKGATRSSKHVAKT